MNSSHYKLPLTTIGLHWMIAFAMIAMIVLGIVVEEMERSPEKFQLMGLHKSIGILILLLALVRLGWRALSKYPEPLSEMAKWQEILSKLTLLVLLLGTVLMPVSGIIMSIGGGHAVAVFGFELVAKTGEKIEVLSKIGHVMHGLGGNLMIAFILLHIAGAFKHERIDKDGTLSRMLGRSIGK
jgi:cytochrome b561